MSNVWDVCWRIFARKPWNSNILETLESINPDLPKKDIDKALKYALIDSLPGMVILEPSGELLVRGDISYPDHLFYKLNKIIDAYYGEMTPGSAYTLPLMTGRTRRRGSSPALYTSLEFRDSYFEKLVTPKIKLIYKNLLYLK